MAGSPGAETARGRRWKRHQGQAARAEVGSADRSRLRFACRFALQLFNSGLSLIGTELLFKALLCLIEAGIAVDLFGAAQ